MKKVAASLRVYIPNQIFSDGLFDFATSKPDEIDLVRVFMSE